MVRGISESNIQRGGRLSQGTGKSMQGDRNSMSDDIIASTPRKRKTHAEQEAAQRCGRAERANHRIFHPSRKSHD